jgi:hypothetical protein
VVDVDAERLQVFLGSIFTDQDPLTRHDPVHP